MLRLGRRRGHGGFTVGVIGGVLLALEALGFATGTAGVIGIGALIAVVAAMTLARTSLRTVAIGATLGAAFFTSWNGFLVGPARPGDLLIFVALACFIAADLRSSIPGLPWWIQQVAGLIILVAVLNEVLPTDPNYLAGRLVLAADGTPYIENQSNLGVAFKFVVGIALLPLVFVLAARHDRRLIRWLTIAFCLGVAVSGFAAFTDHLGLTHLGQSLTHNVYPRDREGGFSNHANFLGAGCVLATAPAVWLACHADRRTRILGCFALPAILLGVYATGSRGATVGSAIALVLAIVIQPRLRKHLPTIAFAGACVAGAAFVASPSLGAALLRATRLGGGTTTVSGSDYVRSLVGEQGIHDFFHSPIDGIGLQVAAEAQNVYIQELASGGVLLFAGMLLFMVGSLIESYRLWNVSDLARSLFVTIVATAILNFAEADLSDRFYYAPAGLIAALAYWHKVDTEAAARTTVEAEAGAEDATPPALAGATT